MSRSLRIQLGFGTLLWLCMSVRLSFAPITFNWPLVLIGFAASVLLPLVVALLQKCSYLSAPRFLIILGGWMLPLAELSRNEACRTVASLIWLAMTFVLAGEVSLKWVASEKSLSTALLAAGSGQLCIGAIWLVADRLHWSFLGFDLVIVRLTAAHFHFAGLVLPMMSAMLLTHWSAPQPRCLHMSGWGVLLGFPLVALGIILSKLGAPLWIESSFAVCYILAVFVIGIAQLKFALTAPSLSKAFLLILGCCLMMGMALALGYAFRAWWPLPALTLPNMWAIHGSLQGFGFCFLGMLGWTFFSNSEANTPASLRR